jgi:hypothetical protein
VFELESGLSAFSSSQYKTEIEGGNNHRKIKETSDAKSMKGKGKNEFKLYNREPLSE